VNYRSENLALLQPQDKSFSTGSVALDGTGKRPVGVGCAENSNKQNVTDGLVTAVQVIYRSGLIRF